MFLDYLALNGKNLDLMLLFKVNCHQYCIVFEPLRLIETNSILLTTYGAILTQYCTIELTLIIIHVFNTCIPTIDTIDVLCMEFSLLCFDNNNNNVSWLVYNPIDIMFFAWKSKYCTVHTVCSILVSR